MTLVVQGSLLDFDGDYIVQQCNCLTVHAHGLSQSIADRFPHGNFYGRRRGIGRRNLAMPEDRGVPGSMILLEPMTPEDGPGIACLLGQWRPGALTSRVSWAYPDYEVPETRERRLLWFQQALASLGQHLRESISTRRYRLAFPYRIGCGLAGGHWPDYEAAIRAFEKQYRDALTVIIYQEEK